MNKRRKRDKRNEINKKKLARQMQTPTELKNGISIFNTAAWLRRKAAIKDLIKRAFEKIGLKRQKNEKG